MYLAREPVLRAVLYYRCLPLIATLMNRRYWPIKQCVQWMFPRRRTFMEMLSNVQSIRQTEKGEKRSKQTELWQVTTNGNGIKSIGDTDNRLGGQLSCALVTLSLLQGAVGRLNIIRCIRLWLPVNCCSPHWRLSLALMSPCCCYSPWRQYDSVVVVGEYACKLSPPLDGCQPPTLVCTSWQLLSLDAANESFTDSHSQTVAMGNGSVSGNRHRVPIGSAVKWVIQFSEILRLRETMTSTRAIALSLNSRKRMRIPFVFQLGAICLSFFR